MKTASTLADRLIAWQRREGRHHLPWQNTRDAYRIWLSEIMLQQTQVNTVIGYYRRFVESFPTVRALAAAPLSQVLEHWSGLGYYRRAHHLHAAAQAVVERYGGVFPSTAEELATLPGVGRSTAAAIAVFAYGQRAAILDGNVRRILARCFGIREFTGAPATERHLWALVERALPATTARAALTAYTQGLMDLGALVCTRRQPRCPQCPWRADCVAYRCDLTRVLPAPRPATRIVNREFVMLMLWRNGRVLLEARRHQRIWSGLWSFPESDSAPAGQFADGELAALVAARWGLTLLRHAALPPIVHKLTHRTFHITPIHVTVRGRLVATAAPDAEQTRFFSPAEARRCALPAPVRRLLTTDAAATGA